MTKKKNTPIKSYKYANGEVRYGFQVHLGNDPVTGERKNTTRRSFKSRKQAELELARIKLAVENGTYFRKRTQTYKELYELWIKQYELMVEESTFVKTKGIFTNHILPVLGAYKIDRISIDVCQQHVNEWATKLKNFRLVKAYAARVIDFAIKREYIRENPFTLVDMPVKKKSIQEIENAEENFYTKEQLLEFLSYLSKEENYKVYALFRLLAWSGIRIGEALALTWKDLNFNANEIRINKALSRGKDNRLYVKSTKNEVIRSIKMDTETMKVLNEWKKKQKNDYHSLGFNTSSPGQLVFSNAKNEYLQPTMPRKWILKVQEIHGLKTITTHGLRHTHSTLLAEANIGLKEIQERLGHKDVRTTMNTYTHVTEAARIASIQCFTNYLTN